MNSYESVAKIFLDLCVSHAVPVPVIDGAMDTDPCDFTSPTMVRLNVKAAGDIKPEYHARHVFGHFIANLHEAADNDEPCVEPALCDQVADVVAMLLEKEGRLTQAEDLLRLVFNNGMNALPVAKSNAIYMYFFRQEHPEQMAAIDQLVKDSTCLK